MTTAAMTKAFDPANLLARIKDQGLPVAEENAKLASVIILGWTSESCVIQGGLVAMIAAGIPYVQTQLLTLEDKIDGANDTSVPAVPAFPALTKSFDVAALVARFKASGMAVLEADAKLLTGVVLDWVGDSALLEGGLVAMLAAGVPYLKTQLLALEDKIAPAPAATV
jgi:hypothetical protein